MSTILCYLVSLITQSTYTSPVFQSNGWIEKDGKTCRCVSRQEASPSGSTGCLNYSFQLEF